MRKVLIGIGAPDKAAVRMIVAFNARPASAQLTLHP
jgi:hypothetical protein